MSNIAVITLCDASNSKGTFKRFVIEDNIGESIHLHIDNMRVDFTVDEYLRFSEIIRASLEELDLLKGFKLSSFDENFLKECSSFLPGLNKISTKEVKLSELKCIVNIRLYKGLVLQRMLPIIETPAYLYLNGKKDKFTNYHQFNYRNSSSEERLHAVLESIRVNGYPYQGSHMVIFKGQNIIRDGQHRAAVLAHLHGVDFLVGVHEFDFNSSKHVFHLYRNNLKAVFMWLAKIGYRRIKILMKSLR